MADVPHLAWPFALAGRQLAVVEQGSVEDVQQSVRSYLSTARGDRPLNPDWGLEDPTFGPGLNPVQLAQEIMDSEDGRADVEITSGGVDGTGRQQLTVSVSLAE